MEIQCKILNNLQTLYVQFMQIFMQNSRRLMPIFVKFCAQTM